MLSYNVYVKTHMTIFHHIVLTRDLELKLNCSLVCYSFKVLEAILHFRLTIKMTFNPSNLLNCNSSWCFQTLVTIITYDQDQLFFRHFRQCLSSWVVINHPCFARTNNLIRNAKYHTL